MKIRAFLMTSVVMPGIFSRSVDIHLSDRSSSPKNVLGRVNRGGGLVDIGSLSTAGAAVVGLSGANGFLNPKGNIEAYGIKDVSEMETATMRIAGAWQTALGFLLFSGTEDIAAKSAYCAAAVLVATIPSCEALGGYKKRLVPWIGITLALGKYADRLPPHTLSAVWGINGLLWYFAPQFQSELYGVTSDKRGQEYMTLSGSTMLCVTAYIALLQAGNSQAQAFAAAWGVNAVTALRFGLSTAKEMDIPTTGPLIWSALSAAIAGLALKA